VQRLFSMFPTGSPGIALLLLRASVAIGVLFDGYVYREHLSAWVLAAAVLIALAAAAGFFTPIVAVLGLLLHALIWFSLGAGDASDALVLSLDALALALLGPGAYSVDSYRFGRRVVVLPEP
jgi:putative oxidoreductase